MSELDQKVDLKRFEEIHDARQKAIETKQSIHKAWIIGRIDYETASRMYRAAVEDYILELKEMIRSAEDELEVDYWDGRLLGEIEFPDGSTRAIRGLSAIIELPEMIEYSYEKEVDKPREGRTTEQVTERVPIPLDVSRTAFQECNHFLNDAGYELAPKLHGGEYEQKYVGLLED